jgi:diacylglycerol kinase (ATP)
MEISANNASNFNVIVAVGGDGSVNEIGKQLINSNTTLAIIPAGSGNGLARNLKIPMNIKKAIFLINQGKTKSIDAVKINNDHFLGTAGVGFDAYISWRFEEAPTRGLLTYLKVALKGFWTYKSSDYNIQYDGKEKKISKGMLVTFANSKQYGNNILIAPEANIDDGLVRLVAVKKFPLIYLPFFGFYLLSQQIHKFKFTEQIESEKITLLNPDTEIHIDGEAITMENKIEVEVLNKSLNVIVP